MGIEPKSESWEAIERPDFLLRGDDDLAGVWCFAITRERSCWSALTPTIAEVQLLNLLRVSGLNF